MKRHSQELVLAIYLGILLVFIAVQDPQFLSLGVQSALLPSVLELALVAVPMTLVIVSSGIDLSVGASMSLSAVAFGLMSERGRDWPICSLAAIATGLSIGLANGCFITKLRVHPLVVTLATLALGFGLAEGISGGRPISGFPNGLAQAVLPASPVLVLLLYLVGGWLAMHTVAGRAVTSIGLNETATRFSAYSVDSLKILLYAMCGTAAGIAAVHYAARRNTVTAGIGQGFELEVVTAVVLGGTRITGGKGTLLGTALGVIAVHETRQFVSWRWEREELNLIVIGLLLIGSVVAHSLAKRTQ